MKSTFFAAVLALAVPAVYAQVPGLPDCASPCLLNNLSKSGCENPTDFKCVCDSDVFVQLASTCIVDSCPQEDIPTAIGAAYALCQSFGVTIPTTLPDSTPAPTTSAPVDTTTVPPPVETTSTPVETTSTPVEVTSTLTSVIVSETTIAISYPVTTLTTTTTGTGDITPTGNSSTPTVSPPPPSNSDSAAVKNIAGLGAMALAVAGFFAL